MVGGATFGTWDRPKSFVPYERRRRRGLPAELPPLAPTDAETNKIELPADMPPELLWRFENIHLLHAGAPPPTKPERVAVVRKKKGVARGAFGTGHVGHYGTREQH